MRTWENSCVDSVWIPSMSNLSADSVEFLVQFCHLRVTQREQVHINEFVAGGFWPHFRLRLRLSHFGICHHRTTQFARFSQAVLLPC